MNLDWGGQALVQKRGQVSDGGIDKIFARWGTPPVPPGKKPWVLGSNIIGFISKIGENNGFILYLGNSYSFICYLSHDIR